MPTKVAQREEVSAWSAIFPNKIDTKNNSCIFMKKLFAIALSNILYLRHILPDRAFRDKVVDGLLLKILQNEIEFPPAARLITWARGCFDALEKNYLKTVIIGIHSNTKDLETAIESYSFRFTYSSDSSTQSTPIGMNISAEGKSGKKTVLKKCSIESVKSAALSVLRTLLLASKTMGELPPSVSISMKLLYYEDVTPPEYEPYGFRPADYSSYRYISETMSLLVGNVGTAYHNMELRMRTDKETFQKQMSALTKPEINDSVLSSGGGKGNESMHSDPDIQHSQKSINLTGLDNDEIDDSQQASQSDDGAPATSKTIALNGSTVATPGCRTGQINATDDSSEHDENDYEVRCPCKFSGDDGIMIVCDHCHKWQHSLCFAILKYEDVPKNHICDLCAIEKRSLLRDGKTDDAILYLDEFDKVMICNYRRLLVMCDNVGSDVSLSQTEISSHLGTNINVVQQLISRLVKKCVLLPICNARGRRKRNSGKVLEWKIEKNNLQLEIPVGFSKKILNEMCTSKDYNIPSNEDVDIDDNSMDTEKMNVDVNEISKIVENASLNPTNNFYDKHRKVGLQRKRKNAKASPIMKKKMKASVTNTPQLSYEE